MRTVNAQVFMLHNARTRKRKEKVYTQYNVIVQIIIGLLIRHYAGEMMAAAGLVARFSEVDREVVKCKCS
jgi:hypothetical protein